MEYKLINFCESLCELNVFIFAFKSDNTQYKDEQ